MPKGFYTAGVVILFERAPELAALERALGRWTPSRRIPGEKKEPDAWVFGGPTLVYPLDEDGPGRVVVDTVDRPWPDDMGDPKRDPMVFGGWTMGHFGPLTFPGNLRRAAEHSWTCPEAKELPAKHRAFVRIRVTHVAGDDDPVIPAGYDPLPELRRTDEMALAIVGLPGALAYFNPNGEVLLTPAALRERDAYDREHELLPLDIWSNIRMFRFDAEWMVMDTVGLGQLDRYDIEVCFSDSLQPGDVDRFLRNVSLYIVQRGEVVKSGETLDVGGGASWGATVFDDGLAEPPRRVLRLIPLDGRTPPEALRAQPRRPAQAKRKSAKKTPAKKTPPKTSAKGTPAKKTPARKATKKR